MSLVQRLLVSKDIDDLIDKLYARYDLPRKAAVFDLALTFLVQVEREDEGFVLGYRNTKENTFYRVGLAEAAQALLASVKSTENATIRHTLLLEDEAVEKIERLRLRFKLETRLQVYRLAVTFLKDITEQEDKEIQLGLYDKKTQTFTLLERVEYQDADKEVKSLIGRLKKGSK